ncbi:MAG: hypothetical protein GYA47_06105 [Desulfovibrio sp.]|nr:hypothetical protein [Desulfovibrio sp.]
MNVERKNDVFEIGLAMAGAISGGAYAAGVIDFLFQALSEWEKAKAERPDDPDIPRHDVRLRVLSGASAGGMTAAVLAASLPGGFTPVTGLDQGAPAPANNKLYQCWVERIDIRHLLTDTDLKKNTSLKSILDSTVLDSIAAYGFGAGGTISGAAWPRYVSDPLDIYLTVANLRGVPYTVRFQGAAQKGHECVRHQDHVRFVLGDAPPAVPLGDGFFLRAGDRSGLNWGIFSDAALATGAFPVGLAPRALFKPKSFYDKKWDIPGCAEPLGEDARQVTFRSRIVPPDWTSGGCPDSGEDLDFLAVDGGLMNNEPFELARKALAGSDPCNPRGLGDVSRAVIMIDPFPAPGWCGKGKDQDLDKGDVLTFAGLMFGALTAQARFKPEEIALALDEDVYSRFLISPSKGNDPWPGSTMAAESLGGFGGFLSRKFRQFDFQLGRRNCQKFLKDHFVLPLEGKTGVTDEDGNTFMTENLELVRSNSVFRNSVNFDTFSYKDSEKHPVLPIIPLCGEAFPPVHLIPRGNIRMTEDELQELRQPIIRRLTAVAGALSGRMIKSGLFRWVVSVAVWFKKQDMADSILDAIRTDLKKKNL